MSHEDVGTSTHSACGSLGRNPSSGSLGAFSSRSDSDSRIAELEQQLEQALQEPRM